MQEVKIEDLTDILKTSTSKISVVVITDPNCPDCKAQTENLESIVEPKYEDMAWFKLHVFSQEDIPLFAPRVVPSMIFFTGTERITEAHGIIEDYDNIIEFIDGINLYEQALFISEDGETKAAPTTGYGS